MRNRFQTRRGRVPAQAVIGSCPRTGYPRSGWGSFTAGAPFLVCVVRASLAVRFRDSRERMRAEEGGHDDPDSSTYPVACGEEKSAHTFQQPFGKRDPGEEKPR